MCCVIGYTGHDISADKFKEYLMRTVSRGPDDQRVVEGPFGLTHEMTVPLTYELNASQLAGTTTVVFEKLYSDGALLAAQIGRASCRERV